MYQPDAWKIIQITNPEGKSHYRVFAGWYGGFAGSDSWKLNSGIVKVEKDGKCYLFHGDSGSIYQCHPNAERMSMYMMSVFASLQDSLYRDGAKMEIVEFEDFEKDFRP